MYKTANNIDQKARQIAKEMIKNEETLRAIPFREAKNTVFVSTDKDGIVAIDAVIVEGRTFYIGHKR